MAKGGRQPSQFRKQKGKGKGKGETYSPRFVCAVRNEPEKGVENEVWTQCDICDVWNHRRCTLITQDEWETLQEEEEMHVYGCTACTQPQKL